MAAAAKPFSFLSVRAEATDTGASEEAGGDATYAQVVFRTSGPRQNVILPNDGSFLSEENLQEKLKGKPREDKPAKQGLGRP